MEEVIIKKGEKTTSKLIISFQVDNDWSIDMISSLTESLQNLYKINTYYNSHYEIMQLRHYISKFILSDFLLYKEFSEYIPHFTKQKELVEPRRSKPMNFEKNIGHRTVIKHMEVTFGIEPDILIVKELKFSSPGNFDFLGLGKIIEEIFALIKYYIPNKFGKYENELKFQQVIKEKISNLKELGFTETEIKKILYIEEKSVENIKLLSEADKIKKIEIKNNS